jgi:hypothetical protein
VAEPKPEVLTLEAVARIKQAAERINYSLPADDVLSLCATVEHYAELLPRCQSGGCDYPAACLGTAEGNPASYACDICCGHGEEDGWCVPLADVPERYADLQEENEKLQVHLEGAVSETKGAEEENARLRQDLVEQAALWHGRELGRERDCLSALVARMREALSTCNGGFNSCCAGVWEVETGTLVEHEADCPLAAIFADPDGQHAAEELRLLRVCEAAALTTEAQDDPDERLTAARLQIEAWKALRAFRKRQKGAPS